MEADIQRAILDWLKAEGFWHRRIPVGAVQHGGIRKKNPLKGMPDILGVLPGGRMFVIEVKDAKGQLSQEQVEVMGSLVEEGALVIMARSLMDVSRKLLPFKPK